jgi:hypothetical protein
MRSLLSVSVLCLVAGTSVASAQEHIPTDAQRDGLIGPVKSVSTSILSWGVQWRQPGGPTLKEPIWCRDCEYAPDGFRTKEGQVVEGVFHGTRLRFVRDTNGQVTERFVFDASTGQLYRHDIVGPFGSTERVSYSAGKITMRQTFTYDEYGQVRDMVSFDGAGKLEAHMLTLRDKAGEIVERSVSRKDGELDWQQTYDPETQVERFTSFDQLGKVNLAWTVFRGNLISFWEPSDSRMQPGDNFNEHLDDDDVDNYACQNDGRCQVSHIRYEYLDAEKHILRSAEWRGSNGQLGFAAYYKYQIDSSGNWTYREVWEWTPELGERTLSETDLRAITYWQK